MKTATAAPPGGAPATAPRRVRRHLPTSPWLFLAPGLLAVARLPRIKAAFLRGGLPGVVSDDAGEVHAEKGGDQQDCDGAEAAADTAARDAEAAAAAETAPEAAALAAPVFDVLAFGSIEPHLSLLVPLPATSARAGRLPPAEPGAPVMSRAEHGGGSWPRHGRPGRKDA